MQPPPQRPPPKQTSTNVFVNEIRQRIDAYVRIAIRNVRDTVPKIIGYNLVRGGMEALEKELFIQISGNEKLAKQLAEPQSVTEERKTLK